MMEDNISNKFNLTEGFILAIIPALGYAVAFIYELAIANVFGYPISFISIGLETVLISIIAVFGFFSSFYLIFDFLAVIIKSKSYESQLGQFMFWGIFLYSLWALILFLGDSGWYGWFLFILLFSSEFLPALIIPLFSKDNGKNYAERFIRFRNHKTEHIRLSNRLLSKLNNNVVYIFLLAGIAIFSASALGTYTAKNTERFFILNNNKQKVVLRVNSNNIIIATIDTTTNNIKDYSIVNALQPGISISKIKIGNLVNTIYKSEKTQTEIDTSKTM